MLDEDCVLVELVDELELQATDETELAELVDWLLELDANELVLVLIVERLADSVAVMEFADTDSASTLGIGISKNLTALKTAPIVDINNITKMVCITFFLSKLIVVRI